MEADFHKFVSVTEIAKDLYLPKELSTRIHKYWTLKRKVSLEICVVVGQYVGSVLSDNGTVNKLPFIS